MKKHISILVFFTTIFLNVCAQDIYAPYRQMWYKKAELYKPVLTETIKKPVHLVRLINDANAFQGWKTTTVAPASALYEKSFKEQSGVIVDFGEHLTGFFEFGVKALDKTPDAPLRFKFTFGEVPAELAVPFDPYTGDLSRAWLQDEIITVMDIPATVQIPRRLSGRYMKIELLGSSQYFDFCISDISFKAVTSAFAIPGKLAATTPRIFKDIDRVGLNTLKECMQTVYEDGPKRDQRLWIGDLYLEALANSYSYKQHDLTKRCLYILAALSAEDGRLIATILEKPEPIAQAHQIILDYSFLYNVTVKDYFEMTGDRATVEDLWPVVKKQVDIARNYCNEDGLMDFERSDKDWWLFFDWKEGLHREVALQGVTLYGLKETYELAKMLGKEKELADVPALIKKMTDAARKNYFDKKRNLFVGKIDNQVSYASQIWMILGGVCTQKEGQKVLEALKSSTDAVIPGTPYLYHYYIQAMINCEMFVEVKEAVADYWGGMVKKGADTFWECYDPNNDYLSPYNFYPVNSYCHAWSCTPVYFIRKYPDIFQK